MKAITLHTLQCKETEDFTGADTCLLEVSRDGARPARYRWTLNNGQTVSIDKTYHCRDAITVELRDEDVGGWLNGADSADFLGSNSIREVTNGRRVVEFTGDGAHYRLSYSVEEVADDGAASPTGVSFRELAERMDPLYPPRRFRGEPVPAGGNVMNGPDARSKGLWGMHRVADNQKPSMRALAHRHLHPDSGRYDFLLHNTWLLDIEELDYVPLVEPVAHDIPARADEFAAEIGTYYDIAGLTEVFEANELYRIRNRLPGDFTDATGPEAGALDMFSGGLVTFTKARIVENSHHTFSEEGGFPDDWASKGVLLTVIDLGVGKIDLYTTHLYAGDGDGEEMYPPRFKQLRELLDFVERTHDRRNVAIVAGDTNIRAEKTRHYQHLVREMRRYDLHDVWPVRGGPKGTTMFVEDGSLEDRCILVQDDDGEHFCDDYASRDATDRDRNRDRIDYVFIEAPQAEHAFNLDVTRMRRKSGWRSQRDPHAPGWDRLLVDESPQYLSDHMGLSTTLIASPK